uniref:Uncharacterized protein n=1 Tax=viral metagenome TaxID=1070528 RepID=A0A6M3L9C6_9ZZZZ
MDDRLKTKVKELIAAGVPEPEIVKFIRDYSGPPIPQYRDPEAVAIERVPEWGRESPALYGFYGAGKAVWEQAVKPTAQAGGMVAGNIVGAPSGPVGIAAGGTLGYGIVKKITDIVDAQIQSFEGAPRQTSIKKEALKSLYDIKDGLEAEMLGQSAGRLAENVFNVVGAPFASKQSLADMEVLGAAKDRGIHMTPTEARTSKSLAQVEALLEKVFGSSDVIVDTRLYKQIEPLTQRLKVLKGQGASIDEINEIGKKIYGEITEYLKKQENITADALNYTRAKIMSKLGSADSLYEIGLSQKDLIRAKSISASEKATEAYKTVGELLPDGVGAELYETPSLAKTANEILSEYKGAAGIDKKLLNKLQWAAKETVIPPSAKKQLDGLPSDLRDQILDSLGDEIRVKRSWQTLQTERAELRDLIEAETAIKSAMPGARFQMTNTGRQYTKLKKAIDKELESIAESTGGEAWEQFQLANAMYGEMADVYKSKTIRSVLKANPEKVVDTVFKPNGITEIQTVKKVLSAGEFGELRSGITNRLLEVDKGGAFDPKALKKQLARYGDGVLKEIYGETTLKELKAVAEKGISLTEKTPHTQFLKTLTNKDPETIVDAIIGAPEAKLNSNNLHANLMRIKQVVTPETFKQVDDLLFEKLMQKHSETGLVKPQSFAKMVDKYARTLKVLNPVKYNELKVLSDIARRFERAERVAGNPSGTGGTIIGWLMYKSPVMGATMSITSRQLAKIYTSEFGLKWLTAGYKFPEGSKKGIEAAVKLTKLLYGSTEPDNE